MVVLLNLDGSVEKRSGTFLGKETVRVPKVKVTDHVFFDRPSEETDEGIKKRFLTSIEKYVTIHYYTKIGEIDNTTVYKETP